MIVEAINILRPKAEFSLIDEKINWLDKKQVEPTKKEINATVSKLILQKNKDKKISEINTACSTEITSGFTSKALGTIRTYQSQELDQLNLIGVVTGGTDDYFKCAKTVSGKLVWSYEMHTVVQLKQVLNDGKAHKQALLQKAGTLKAKVDLAKTQADLDLIVW